MIKKNLILFFFQKNNILNPYIDKYKSFELDYEELRIIN